jgi:hypothetical protein
LYNHFILPQPLSSFAFFHLKRRSLIRANILVLGSFAASFYLSGFPGTRPNLLLLLPALAATVGTIDTLRCLTPQRDLYHAGIILCLFMDMLALCLIFFFLLFPYLF